MSDASLTFTVPDELIERTAERALQLVLGQLDLRLGRDESPYLTVTEAASYLRCSPQRIYDLLSARRLTRHKDGRRVLVARADLDAHVTRTYSNRVAPGLPPTLRTRSPKRLAARGGNR
jgi:excisionase family DNA binding protein